MGDPYVANMGNPYVANVGNPYGAHNLWSIRGPSNQALSFPRGTHMGSPYGPHFCPWNPYWAQKHLLPGKGWFLYWWVISRPEHNIWFNFCDLLTFYLWFYLLTGRMPLKSRLPLVVQCWFFVPINCNLGSYFPDGYVFLAFLLFKWKIGIREFFWVNVSLRGFDSNFLFSHVIVFSWWSLIRTSQIFFDDWNLALCFVGHFFSLIWITSLKPLRYIFSIHYNLRLLTAFLTVKEFLSSDP